MIAIGIVLNLVGLGIFCWLLFTLAVYALPFFVGATTGVFAYHSGAGPLGAIAVGLLAGGTTLAAAQIVFALVRAPFLRIAVALLFAAPAALAGFFSTHGLAALTTSSQTWQNIFAVIGAAVIGATAWLRLADAPLDGATSGADRDSGRHHGLTTT
jgi:hypothetical protein